MFNCSKCQSLIEVPGALAFSPPLGGRGGCTVEKFHLCTSCWQAFLYWLSLPAIDIYPPYVFPPPTTVPERVFDEPVTAPDPSWPPGEYPYEITCQRPGSVVES